MKVKMMENAEMVMTKNQWDMAQEMIADLREDEYSPGYYAKVAIARMGRDFSFQEVVRAEAEAVPARGRGYFSREGYEQNVDVSIRALLFGLKNHRRTYVEVLASLADIWSICNQDDDPIVTRTDRNEVLYYPMED